MGTNHSKKNQITEHTVEIRGLKKKFKAVHLSDIHIGRFRSNAEYLQEIIDKTNALNPDIIFFTGDYLDATITLKDKHFAPLSKLKAPLYFVEGNHDVVVNAPVVLKKAKKYGAKVLANEMIEWNGIQVIGLNHMVKDENTHSRHTTSTKSTIKQVLDELAPIKTKPSILLHHSPDGIKYANKHAVDLYLAGHTHGGQMWPVTKISDYFFPYNIGLSHYKSTSIFVSQGIGTAGPPMRLGTNAEIVVIHLVPLL
ncbi:hypothetical protein C7377_1497 [Balneicella halophila]|uniref:Calcineurin-like phosphoesterase domain-containing protein n=1 Tax=Balneicella halophila TaxID=1537566 RepID=A0A7L4UMU9_BALHA|nr:metallophosphoesterase [Balneicella halophila]PVX49859.1 hypothetical protein C7377_1497 [Balneicella halophila]